MTKVSHLTTARTAEFMPWASPPLVNTAITFPVWVLGKITLSSHAENSDIATLKMEPNCLDV
jgi:hypothetical protein